GGRAPAPREGARRRPARAGGPRACAAQLPGARGPGPPRRRRISRLPRMARRVDRPRRLKAPAARPPLERAFSAGGLGYRRPRRVWKRVRFFLMRSRGGRFGDRDREMDAVRWFSLDEAERVAAFENERALVRRARTLLAGE